MRRPCAAWAREVGAAAAVTATGVTAAAITAAAITAATVLMTPSFNPGNQNLLEWVWGDPLGQAVTGFPRTLAATVLMTRRAGNGRGTGGGRAGGGEIFLELFLELVLELVKNIQRIDLLKKLPFFINFLLRNK